MLNIVVVASEAVPFAKTGGLADVAGALPRALGDLGHQVCLFLPCYGRVWSAGMELASTGLTLRVPVGTQRVDVHVHQARLPGSRIPVFFIDYPPYFDREDLYQVGGKDYPDNCERFVLFDRAVLEAIPALGIRPDVVHCNDWQTGLIPVYLKTLYRGVSSLASAGTLYTIHNLAYLGLFRHWDMPLTGLDWSLFNYRALEFHGRLSFMKGGLVFSDMLSTVSPTYAREIQTPEMGCGLHLLLKERRTDLAGIVNGIDVDAWTPSHEPMLAQPFDVATFRDGKAKCKAWLQKRAGLSPDPDIPLLAQIGRLDAQKGWDLLADVVDRLLEREVQLVVLGTGQPRYHALLTELMRRHRGKFWAYLGFSDDLAHQIEAGADISLMPSLFEPCGLNQLYSLAHGTVPIVRQTGGLADTVVDVSVRTLTEGTATGFVFTEPTPEALWDAIGEALNLWEDRIAWQRLMEIGMRADWSWHHSALEYQALYEAVRRRARGRSTLAMVGEPGPSLQGEFV